MENPKDTSDYNLPLLIKAARVIGVPDWKFVEFVERCQEAGEVTPDAAAKDHGHHDGRQQTREWTNDDLKCLDAVSKTTRIRLSRILRFAHDYHVEATLSSGTTPASRPAGGLPADGVLFQYASPIALSVRVPEPPCGAAQEVPVLDDSPIEWFTDMDFSDYDPLSDLGDWTPDSGPAFADQDDTVILVSMSEALAAPSHSPQPRQPANPGAAQPELGFEIIPHPHRTDNPGRALEAGVRPQAAGISKPERRVRSRRANQGKYQQALLATQLRQICVPCSIAHKRCTPAVNGGKCQRCLRQAYTMSRLGCVYFSIVDITLFRTMTDPISQKAYENLRISERLCGRAARRLEPAGSHGVSGGGLLSFKLTQGFGTYLQLPAQRFDVGDIRKEELTLSEQALYSHPYSIAGDYQTLSTACERFVIDSIMPYISTKTSDGDALTRSMFKAAVNYAGCKNSRVSRATYGYAGD